MNKFKKNYFNHEFNAFTNSKIQDLFYDHKFEGIGVYWVLIEHLHNNQGSIKKDFKKIAFTIHSEEDKVKSIICDYNLFVVGKDSISNSRVVEFLNEVVDKSLKAQMSANARWNKKTQPSKYS